MRASPTPDRARMKRGWCPTLDTPMQSGDGLLVRIQPRHARLNPTQARTLATAAERHGNGIIELTQRGNLQLRGLRDTTIDPFAAAMAEAYLPSPGHVLPPPLLGDDPTLNPAAEALVERIEAALSRFQLPPKLTIAIEAGGILANRPIAADLVATPTGLHRPPQGHAPAPVGPLTYPGTQDAAFGLAPPFGQLDAAMLHALADLAERHATTLRITPWRAILLGRIPRTARIAPGPAWIVDPEDPRLLVTACIGAPACLRATTPTRIDAARLRPTRPTHVSGCIKGCAHPAPAPVTYVARDGRYDLVLDGRASDRPIRHGVTL